MREIKFRGLDINGDWHYGMLAIIPDTYTWHVPTGYYISNKYGSPYAYQVRSETVGQCTGLQDRKSKEIYEGDIVKCFKLGAVYIVRFDMGSFKVGLNNLSSTMEHLRVKVIGNIYENPELLEGK